MNEPEKIPVKKKSALPLWVCAAVWIIAGLFFPLYRVLHFVIVAVLAAAAGIITRMIAPDYTVYVDAPRPTSGNQDVDTLCCQLEETAWQLRCFAATLPKHKVKFEQCINTVAATLNSIQKDLLSDPADLPACRRLASYYLPTIRKLAEKYASLVQQFDMVADPPATLFQMQDKIENAFVSIDGALKKQLDALYANDHLDISSDIDVLNAMLRRDGLADE